MLQYTIGELNVIIDILYPFSIDISFDKRRKGYYNFHVL